MKKFLLISLVAIFSTYLQAGNTRLVHEWTVDLYYANGVLADARNSSYRDWQIKSIQLKSKYPSLKKALKYGEAKLSYNASYLLGVADLFEAIGQWENDQGGQAGEMKKRKNKKGKKGKKEVITITHKEFPLYG